MRRLRLVKGARTEAVKGRIRQQRATPENEERFRFGGGPSAGSEIWEVSCEDRPKPALRSGSARS
jgi:hypothetical protein